MNPLITQYIWQICETHLPELQFKLRSFKAPFSHALPSSFDAVVKAAGYEKAYNDYFTQSYSTDKRVLALPIHGEISRTGYWNYGNDFYIRQLAAAAKDPDYVGAVLDVNSGGGSADSTPELCQAVADFRKVKPINAVSSYAGSAAYYIICPCNEIFIINQAASSMGSIGTLLLYENYMEYLKLSGISMEIIRATASINKARVNPYEELTEEARAGLQAVVDACQKEFAGAVKRYRAGKITSSDVMTGLMFGLDDSIKYGLADKKGNMADAVKSVLELSK